MKLKIILALFLILPGLACFSQKVPIIKDIDFSLIDNKLVIKYNIDNYKINDKYNVKVEIYKASGVKINAFSFTGDLKEVQSVEDNKVIWDIEKDNVELDDDIYVIISGEVITEPDVIKTEETPQVIKKPISVVTKNIQPVNRTACFFKSLAFPGWGTSEITQRKGNYVKGVISYGAVIGSVVMAKMSNDSYSNYESATTSTNRDYYFDLAKKRNIISMVLAGGAAVIWSVDLISVLTVKNKTSGQASTNMNLDLGYSLAAKNTHMFTCKLRF